LILNAKKPVTIHHTMKRRNVYPESGDTIPIQKTKTNWIMSPVSYQLIRYAISVNSYRHLLKTLREQTTRSSFCSIANRKP